MAFIDDWNLTQNGPLKQRMTIACAQVATEVIGETDQGTGTKRDKRAALAAQFLSSPHHQAERFMLAVIAANHPANENVTDAQILTAVRAVWNDLAGVHNGEV